MQDASAGRRYNPAYCPAATLHCSRSDVPVPSQPYVYRSKLKWYILHPEQIETPQLHQARWWWRASVFHVDGVRFVGNGNHRVLRKNQGWDRVPISINQIRGRAASIAFITSSTIWSAAILFSVSLKASAQMQPCKSLVVNSSYNRVYFFTSSAMMLS